MTDMVNVKLEDGQEAQVPAEFAEAHDLEVLEPVGRPKAAAAVVDDNTLVRVKLDDGSEVTVARSFASLHSLTVLDKPATNAFGVALNAKPHVDLAGKALDEALKAAGLPTGGKADEKRARLADHQASGAPAPANTNTEGVSP